jgi:hypothetical protein
MTALTNFFLNKTTEGGTTMPASATVSSPAFSITKVLTAGAVVIAPLGTVLVKIIQGKDFKPTPDQVVTLIIGLLGFVALLASADVLARAIGAGADSRATAMAQLRDSENLIPFATPMRATLKDAATDPEVRVFAATGGSCAHFLIKKPDDSITWVLADNVRVLGPA